LTGRTDHATAKLDGPVEPIIQIAQHPDHPAELDPIVISIAMTVHVGNDIQQGTHLFMKGLRHEAFLTQMVCQQTAGSCEAGILVMIEAGTLWIKPPAYIDHPHSGIFELRIGDLPGAGNRAFSDVFEDQGDGHDLVCVEGSVVGDDAVDMHGGNTAKIQIHHEGAKTRRST
jgi:hypothetical protein